MWPCVTAAQNFPSTSGNFPSPFAEYPSVIGKFPSACANFPTAIGEFPSAFAEFPSPYGKWRWVIGNNPTAFAAFPTASGNFPTACGEWRWERGRKPSANGGTRIADPRERAGDQIERCYWKRVYQPMPTPRTTSLLLLLLTLDLCAQGGTQRVGVAEIFCFNGGPTFTSTTDSLDFAEFQERHMSKGGSHNLLSRSKGYRMAWLMHRDGDECTVVRGDGRTLEEFQDDPPPGYTPTGEKPKAYGSWCVVVQMVSGPRRSTTVDRWYFEAP